MTAILVVDEPENPLRRAPLVEGKNDFASVTNIIAGVAERRTPRGWYLMFGCAIALFLNLIAMIGYLVFTGIGVWGNNIPVGWGWPIVNFVFWIGIGHAGTLISAILFLFRQKWRTSINRASEAMTIFAVMAAGIFPAIHVGRLWSSTGCSRCRTRWRCGPTSRARCSGTCSRSAPTSRSRRCSGSSV